MGMMNAYEMAVAMTNDPAAFKAEMDRRSAAHLVKIAASAARVYGLTPEQHAVYYAAIKDLPHALPGKRKGTMVAVPVDEIGMAAVKEMK